MGLAETYRRRLREVALDLYGYVTIDKARSVSVPPGELRRLAARGGLTKVGHGLYRFDDIPVLEYDSYMEAVLGAGEGAVLAGESVLALHNLGQVNPKAIQVYTSRRVRRTSTLPVSLTTRSVPEDDRTFYFGIPSTTVKRALIDSLNVVPGSRLVEAVDDARSQGMLTREEHEELIEMGICT